MLTQTLKKPTLVAFAGLLMSGLVVAQDIRLEERTTQKVPTGTDAEVDADATFMTSDFMGLIVKDKADNNLGEVRDLVINAQGEVLYLAVQPQQGREEDGLVFLPFAALNLDGSPDQKITHVTTVITRERFIEAPIIPRQRFYAAGGPAPVFAQVNRFFGVRGPRIGFGFDGRGRRDGFRGDRDGRDRRDMRDRDRDGRERGDRDRDGRNRDGRNDDQDSVDSDNPADRNSDAGERTGRRMRRDRNSDTPNGRNGSTEADADAEVDSEAKVGNETEVDANAEAEAEAGANTPMKPSGSTETDAEVEAEVDAEGSVETPTQPTSPQSDQPATEQPGSPAPEAKPES